MERATLSAEENNWDYDKIQNIKYTKHKKGFYHETLLGSDIPIKIIIDSGSRVTLIPDCLFNKITKMKPLETNYKNVITQKIEFTAETTAMVRTNKEISNLPLLITKASPLIGMDWMQRLKMNLNSSNDAILIHHVKLEGTETRIINFQNDFKELFYNNREIMNLSVKINLKDGAQKIQQKKRPIVS